MSTRLLNARPAQRDAWELIGIGLVLSLLATLALKYPAAAAIVVIIGVIVMILCAAWIVRAVKRRWGRTPPPAALSHEAH